VKSFSRDRLNPMGGTSSSHNNALYTATLCENQADRTTTTSLVGHNIANTYAIVLIPIRFIPTKDESTTRSSGISTR
jgi:hypothetical protein